jgi:CheY-like chemotaxis protein
MPVMDGYTATRELRRQPQWQHLPVIAMTASALADDRDRALASGMNAHITKPIHVESMLRTMADWVRGGSTAARPSPAEAAPAAAHAPLPSAPAINATEGLAYCMGNEELYSRLLNGFRSRETGFADEVQDALATERWPDAQRRTHDLKGLAGTIGAQRLRVTAQKLQAAIIARDPQAAQAALDEVRIELGATLTQCAASPRATS